MLKITTTYDSRDLLVLRIEGRLMSGWVAELLAACHVGASPSRSVELDVSGLSFADGEGIAALRRLAERGLQVTNCSPFMAELIKESSP